MLQLRVTFIRCVRNLNQNSDYRVLQFMALKESVQTQRTAPIVLDIVQDCAKRILCAKLGLLTRLETRALLETLRKSSLV